MQKIGHLIDGTLVEATSGNTGPVYDPSTGVETGRVALASVTEVDAAVTSAETAFEEWGQTSLARRTKLMISFRNLVVANADEIARRLRRMDPAMSLILITGWQLEADDPRAAAFDFSLRKPFMSLVEVEETVRRAVQLCDQRRSDEG